MSASAMQGGHNKETVLTSKTFLMRPAIFAFIISPGTAVAKYCDEHVCLCLSVCLSVREHISRATRAIFTNFLCMLRMVVARFFAGGVTKGQFWFFSSPLTMYCLQCFDTVGWAA